MDEAKPLRDGQEFPLCSQEQELAPLLFKSFRGGNDLKTHDPTRYSVGGGRGGGCWRRCQEATVRGSRPSGGHEPGRERARSSTGSQLG